jgi:acyl carrier protein
VSPSRETVDRYIAEILILLRKTYANPDVVSQLDPELPMQAQGMDSVDMPLMVLGVQDQYKVVFEDRELARLRTLRDFATLLAQKLGAR